MTAQLSKQLKLDQILGMIFSNDCTVNPSYIRSKVCSDM
jgi:hypothetical protein